VTNLTGRPVLQKPESKPEVPQEKRERFAWVRCPCSDPELENVVAWPDKCQYCRGKGQLKLKLIRVAPGSAAKSGMSKMKRTPADIKFSNAVRERENWICSVCQKDFKDRPDIFDAMHLIKRRYRALRKGYTAHTGDGCCLKHDLGNSLAGCRSCHMRLEGKPENEQHFRAWFGDAHVDALLEQKPKSQKIVERS
jgi:hypothetical protein